MANVIPNFNDTNSAGSRLTPAVKTEVELLAQKSKVDGIAANATANDTDANLKNRANHTGNLPVAALNGGTGAGPTTYWCGNGTWTIPAGGGGGYTPGGTDVAIADGGTGVSTLPAGLLKGAGTSPITVAVAGTDFVAPGGALGTPASGTLTNCTGLPVAGTTGTLPVNRGGTGAATLPADNVLLGAGTGAVQAVAPSTTGNVLTSNGTTWQSSAPPSGTMPSQTGNAGKFLSTNGTTPAWSTVSGGGGSSDVAVQEVAVGTGDSATDVAAIHAAQTALPAQGGTIMLKGGGYNITNGVTLSKRVKLTAPGCWGWDGSTAAATVLYSTSATGTAITVTEDGCTIENIMLDHTGSAPTAGGGIRLTAGAHALLNRVWVHRFYDNLRIEAGGYWTVRDCYSNNPIRYAGYSSHAAAPDAGDGLVTGCRFSNEGGATLAAAGWRWESGGGLRFTDNKVNGNVTAPGQFDIGVDFAYASTTASTADLFVHDCSLENMATNAVKLSRPSGTQTVTGVQIHDNELMNVPTAFAITTAGFRLVSIHDNTGIGSSMTTGVSVNAAADAPQVYANIWDNPSITPISGPFWTPVIGAPRVGSVANAAAPAINVDLWDKYGLTAQTSNINFSTNISGNPTSEQELWIWIVTAASVTINWGAYFQNGIETLPPVTVAGERMDLGFTWNAAATKFRCQFASSNP